jgi:hypothetical protein
MKVVDARHRAGHDESEFSARLTVMAGLVPAIHVFASTSLIVSTA